MDDARDPNDATRSPPPVRSFRDFFKSQPEATTAATPGRDTLEDLLVNLPFREASTHCKEDASSIPAVTFTQVEVDRVASPFRLCLVFKFYKNHPALEEIKRVLKDRWSISNPCSAFHVDRRHVLIRFVSSEDLLKAWTRGSWTMLDQSVKIFRWSPWFKPGLESPLVPLWFSIPHLPACLFSSGALASIASGLGRLLRIGPATLKLGRVEAARICVEVDASKSIPSEIWIALGDDGFLQEIIPDFLPSFCLKCRKHGHLSTNCNVQQEQSLSKKQDASNAASIPPAQVEDKARGDSFQTVQRRRRRTRWTPIKDNAHAKPNSNVQDDPSVDTTNQEQECHVPPPPTTPPTIASEAHTPEKRNPSTDSSLASASRDQGNPGNTLTQSDHSMHGHPAIQLPSSEATTSTSATNLMHTIKHLQQVFASEQPAQNKEGQGLILTKENGSETVHACTFKDVLKSPLHARVVDKDASSSSSSSRKMISRPSRKGGVRICLPVPRARSPNPPPTASYPSPVEMRRSVAELAKADNIFIPGATFPFEESDYHDDDEDVDDDYNERCRRRPGLRPRDVLRRTHSWDQDFLEF